MPIGFFTRAQTGALVSRLNNDVQGAQQAFTSMLSNVVGNIVTVAVTLTAMFVLSWQITLLALVMLPLFVLPAKWIGRRLADLTRERYRLNGEMGQMMTERFNVSGALLVKLFGDPDRESASFDRRAGRVRDIGVTTAMYQRVLMTALGLLASLATALVYGLGGVMAISGSIAIGTVVALTAYLNRLYGPLTSLSNVQVDVMTTLVSFERVLEVLDLQPSITDRADARELPRGSVGVELTGVTFRYPTAAEVSLASLEGVARLDDTVPEPILHGIDLRVEPGQTLALVGPSGAGKTTITGLVSRLYDPTTGSVRVGGVDLRDATTASVRDRVGVVSQDSHLFHDTLRANLRYARRDATDDQIIEALQAAQVWDVVRALPDGLDTVVGDRGHRMSGGEKQRIAIARLLLKDPSVVILDEATAHLDAGVGGARAASARGRTRRPDLDRDRPPARHGPCRRRHRGGRRTDASSSMVPTRNCSPATGCTPASPGPSSPTSTYRARPDPSVGRSAAAPVGSTVPGAAFRVVVAEPLRSGRRAGDPRVPARGGRPKRPRGWPGRAGGHRRRRPDLPAPW